jgi:hypothetical protein
MKLLGGVILARSNYKRRKGLLWTLLFPAASSLLYILDFLLSKAKRNKNP